MEFLMENHLLGLVIGIATFLIIGLFHPVVIKAEYYWGTGCWWIFLILGVAGIIWSLCTDNVLIAALSVNGFRKVGPRPIRNESQKIFKRKIVQSDSKPCETLNWLRAYS